ncbi:MAG: hypothetical protein KGP29_00060 [Proteobacteria bacterium]|nr:hypothetical protein [Pseudomonadota bacterium]
MSKKHENISMNEATPDNLKLLSEVFKLIETETAEIAEMVFDYLVDVLDEYVMTGTISENHPNPKVRAYIKILNRLFLLSRKNSDKGSFKLINRKTVQDLDKKTYTICMCFDGGVSLDILCDIVNVENQGRTPAASPVKVTVKQVFLGDLTHSNSRGG